MDNNEAILPDSPFANATGLTGPVTESKPPARRGRPPKRLRQEPPAETAPAAVPNDLVAELERVKRENAALKKVARAAGALPPEKEPRYKTEHDPLFWIDQDTASVTFIGKLALLRLTRGYNDAKGSQDPVYAHSTQTRQWGSCPFQFTHKIESEAQNLKAGHLLWHVIPLSKQRAEDAYSLRDAMPAKVVVSVQGFKGLDSFSNPKGELEASSGIALREAARLALQRNPESLFIDTDTHHDLIEQGWLNPKRPNPYGMQVASGAEGWTIQKGQPTLTQEEEALLRRLGADR